MLRRKEMKIFTKHVTTFLLAIATALSLCLAIACMNPGKVSATDLSGNLATNAENWQATGDGITFGENGIKIANTSNSAKAVALKTKVNGEATITLKFKASENLSGFQVMFKDARDTVPTAVGYNQGGIGHRLLVDLRRIGDYVANYTVAHYQDGGQPWPNWPGEFVATDNSAASADGKLYNQYFDGNEHAIVISTVDVENGVKVSVNVGGRQLLSEKVIEDATLCGEQYLSFGCFESVADSELTITSVTVKVPEPPAEKDLTGNVALKENQWVAKGDKITFSEEGITLASDTDYNVLNMVSTLHKINAKAVIALTYKASGNVGNFYIQFKDTRDSVPTNLGYSDAGNRIVIQMRRTAGADPNYFVQAFQNNGGPNYFGNGALLQATNEGTNLNSSFDGKEHKLFIVTEDVDTGVKVSVYLDTYNFKIVEKVVEGEGLKGDHYLSFGVFGFNANTNFTMTSVEINESTERNFEGDLSGNLATKADMWMANNGKISFGNEGITIASETASSTNASVVLKQKVAANAIMRIKFKASEGLDNFIVQFKDPRSVMPHGAGYGYEGSQLRLSVDLRGSNLPLPTKNVILFNNATPDSDNPTWGADTWFCTGDGSASNQYFDNEEHEMVIATRDSKTGVQVFARVDGEKLYQGTVKKKALFGEQYIAIGCKSLKQNTNVTITSVEIDQPVTGDEVSVIGASLRIVDGEFTGFRFNLAFDKETLDCLIADGAGVNITSVTVGAVIAPKWMVDGGTALEIGATDVLNIENDKELFEKDGKYLLNAVITNIGSVTENVNRYKMEFMARAYVKVTYKNGDIEIYYGEAITRSIAGVAADALEAQGDVLEADVKSVLEEIVNACNA